MSPDEHERSHIRKAQHNAQHLTDITQKLDTCPDWCITVAFYVALHYVEAFLAKRGLDPQDAEHDKRNLLISHCDEDELVAIRSKYLALYSKSKLARYKTESQFYLKKGAAEFVRDGSVEIPKLLGYNPP